MNIEIADIISKRVTVVRKIAKYKHANGMQIVDENRESAVIAGFEDEFEKRGISRKIGKIIAKALIKSAIEEENTIIKNN